MKHTLVVVCAVFLVACVPAAPKANKPSPAGPPPPPLADEGIVCPADVRQCPDGTYVSRDPDNGCAFRTCPDAAGSR